MADLPIDTKYYNKLDIDGFSKMMNSPTCSYKFYWLEAIVQLISANKTEATYDEIINKMISNAWYPVLEYHIHLSGIYGEGIIKDNLEKAVLRLQKLSGLANNASDIEVTNKLLEFSEDKELNTYKKDLTKNVPYKALSEFANRGTEKIDLESSAGRMIAYYNRLSENEILLPYTFNDGKSLKRVITFQDDWIQMMKDNTVNILGWIQLEKVKWLQKNNPEVPGLVYKLARDDGKQRKMPNARKLWDAVMEIAPIIDVFKDEPIDTQDYDLDHFIPHSFVMNDELWNLMPMDSFKNSKKIIGFWNGICFSLSLRIISLFYMKSCMKSPEFTSYMKRVTETIYILSGRIGNFIEKEIQKRSSVGFWRKICNQYTIQQEDKATKFGILHRGIQ